MTCTQCGAPIENGAVTCQYCGTPVQNAQPQQPVQMQQGFVQQIPQQVIYVQQRPEYPNGINPAWPVKNKIAAGVLAILLGTFGIHKFYLGNSAAGIMYLIFCWTGIPSILGIIEGIIYLCSNDENFQKTNHVKLK